MCMVGASPVVFTPTGQLIPNQVEFQRTLLRDLFSGIALFPKQCSHLKPLVKATHSLDM